MRLVGQLACMPIYLLMCICLNPFISFATLLFSFALLLPQLCVFLDTSACLYGKLVKLQHKEFLGLSCCLSGQMQMAQTSCAMLLVDMLAMLCTVSESKAQYLQIRWEQWLDATLYNVTIFWAPAANAQLEQPCSSNAVSWVCLPVHCLC